MKEALKRMRKSEKESHVRVERSLLLLLGYFYPLKEGDPQLGTIRHTSLSDGCRYHKIF